MTRQRISTTVDADLLARARALDLSGTDASMIERALRALLADVRAGEIDQAYAAGYAAVLLLLSVGLFSRREFV